MKKIVASMLIVFAGVGSVSTYDATERKTFKTKIGSAANDIAAMNVVNNEILKGATRSILDFPWLESFIHPLVVGKGVTEAVWNKDVYGIVNPTDVFYATDAVKTAAVKKAIKDVKDAADALKTAVEGLGTGTAALDNPALSVRIGIRDALAALYSSAAIVNK